MPGLEKIADCNLLVSKIRKLEFPIVPYLAQEVSLTCDSHTTLLDLDLININ